ncbi:class F sortase [Candidatus Saccharibacteria bacterium]|nr:class F sortase [Candidatus Saccharibacteria bacterium]
MSLKINRRLEKTLRIIAWILLAIILVAMIKILIWERHYYNTKSSELRATAPVVIEQIASAINPSEISPSPEDIESHQTTADQPRYLEIDRLDIRARIQTTDIPDNNILPVPDNIYDVSWYAGSGRPGENTCVIISGLSSGNTQPGVFANLDSLETNDPIIIELGNGDRYTYRVRELTHIQSSDAETKLPDLQRRLDDQETLSLITATHGADNNDTYDTIVMLRANLSDKQLAE